MLLLRLREEDLNAVLLLPRRSFEILHQHPERLMIMSEVARQDMSFSKLQERLSMPKSTLHRHLRVLAAAGWIQTVKDGRQCIVKPTALVYLGFDVQEDSLILLRDYVGIIAPHCGAFILKAGSRPVFTSCHGDSCDRKSDCVRDLVRIGRRLGIDVLYEEPTELLLAVFREAAIQEIRATLATQLISIPICRSRVLYRELLVAASL